MRAEDFIGAPCYCPNCHQAGVAGRETRRDPRSGAMLHGYDLRRWYEARDRFRKLAREAVGAPGRHGTGFERVAVLGESHDR